MSEKVMHEWVGMEGHWRVVEVDNAAAFEFPGRLMFSDGGDATNWREITVPVDVITKIARLSARVETLDGAVAIYAKQSGELIAENERLREVITELRGICGVRTVGWEIAQEALEASDEG